MTTNALNFVIIVVTTYLCSTTQDIKALPAPLVTINKDSFLYEIKNDNQTCKASSPLYDSIYAKYCNNIKYPNKNFTFDPDDSLPLLCFGLYDRILRLCHLDSLKPKHILPSNASIFETEVEKIIPKKMNDIDVFCRKWDNAYPPMYNKILEQTTMFEEKMKIPIACIRICTDKDIKFIPLCAALAKMDEISKSSGTTLTSAEQESKTTAGSTLQQVNLSHPIAHGQAIDTKVAHQNPDKITHSSSDPATKASKSLKKNLETQNNLSGAQTQGKTDQGDSPSGTKPKQSESNTNGVSVSAPSTPNKNAANDKAATARTSQSQTQSQTDGQNETEKIQKKLQTNRDNMQNNAKDSVGPTQSGAGTDNIQGIPGNENLDATDAVLEGPASDVISEHTQEDTVDQFQEVEPAEAVDPVFPEEDSDRKSFQQSEKHGYVPRMPGMPNEDDSHFFGYMTVIGVICIAGYFGYHNKQKILAMVLEGRRTRGGRNRRRPSTANYRKLDCTLEEAVTSQCNSNVTHVIY